LEKDVHQLAANFLREVQFGQRVRKIREAEQSHRIEIDVPENFVLVRLGCVVTHFEGFKSEKALFAHDAKLAQVMAVSTIDALEPIALCRPSLAYA
jgi:hypothetical protein